MNRTPKSRLSPWIVFLGGTVVGGLAVALLRRSSAPATLSTLPAGAAAIPVSTTTPMLHFAEAQPGQPISPQLARLARPWVRPPKDQSKRSSFRTFPTLDALMASCPTQAEMDQIRADFDIRFGPGVDTTFRCAENGTDSNQMLSVYNWFRVAAAMNFDAPLPIIGSTNLYQWLKSLNVKWYLRFPTTEDPYNRAACSDDSSRSSVPGAGCVIDTVIINASSPGDTTEYPARVNPLRRHVRGTPELTGMNLIPGDALAPALLAHEGKHTDAGGRMYHACSDSSGTRDSADSSLSYGGCYGLQYYIYLWMADHLPTGFLNPAQRHQARMIAWSMRGPGGKFCDDTAQPEIPLPSGRDLLTFWGMQVHHTANEQDAAALWFSRDTNWRHLEASSLVLVNLPAVATSDLALSLSDYVHAYGQDRATSAARQAMDDEAARVALHPTPPSVATPRSASMFQRRRT